MWKPANLGTLGTLLIGNVHLLYGTHDGLVAYSLLANLFPWLLWPAILAIALWIRSNDHRVRPLTGFLGIWLFAVLAAYSAYPRLPYGFYGSLRRCRPRSDQHARCTGLSPALEIAFGQRGEKPQLWQSAWCSLVTEWPNPKATAISAKR